jgi:hypothetical protein
MINAQVQPLNTPTASELTKARDFLWEADMLVADVKSLFRNSGDFAIAARLKDIQGRLADEIRAVDRYEQVGLSSLNAAQLRSSWVWPSPGAGVRAGKGTTLRARACVATLDCAPDARVTLRPAHEQRPSPSSPTSSFLKQRRHEGPRGSRRISFGEYSYQMYTDIEPSVYRRHPNRMQ